ncbi:MULTISPECIES: efflux RND transporter periplasmic adaptor subunit [unclassified Methylophilus]|jgi:cobalt-zinc-cadmium efflux system membrane fusion protein|uniref:Efflux RND transporter periplasmic adaptor subunit n=1 Tax=Methylophilus glucosoxydans TaxID=752553 RepID=A0ABW3GHZ7_9PROT|nr:MULTISPECIES: efflux RND transporter periplasmic adaptor subunit [unclassified Methylophilus]MBF4988287.1 efflux RND transporter periplasmic adaptor subunit [Methylophilus sp. 14]MBF4990755.1 efflux RND transporter periplasmic adaptor subunit [Methylophilus sp. QUAN]
MLKFFKNLYVVALACSVIIFFILLSGCSSKSNQAEGAKTEPSTVATEAKTDEDLIKLSNSEIQQSGVTIAKVTKQPIQDQLSFTANILANQNKLAHVTPRIEGKLSKVIANLGDHVKTGQTLAEIDSIQMGEARAQFRSSKTDLALAQANFDRISKLYEDKVVPQKQFIESQSALERAKSALYADSERLRMYGGLGQPSGSTYVLKAPFNGIVIEKNAVIGELANPADTIFTIADMSTVWIDADVPERDLQYLEVGKTASVTVTAYPDEVFTGKVSYLSSVVDKTTRTVKARIELPNADQKLRIDMFAKVVLNHSGTKEVLVAPNTSVVMVQGIPNVYVSVEGGFKARAVELGARYNEYVEIKTGLTEDESIVQTGVYALKARQLKSQISDEH